jgi:hypothetical protein
VLQRDQSRQKSRIPRPALSHRSAVARAALVALKLSAHPQFAHKGGACALVEKAEKEGDASLRSFAERCRA